MNSRRTAKVAQAIKEAVSTSILFELKDPRIQNVTVIHVEMSGDLRHAKVYFSVMGDEQTQQLCVHGLRSARGYLQSKIADRLKTRYTPILNFVLDAGVKKSFETSRLIDQALAEAEPTNLCADSPTGQTIEDGSESEASGAET